MSLITVKYFFHICPPVSLLCIGNWFLTRICLFPPSLCTGVLCHFFHVVSKIISDVLVICKQMIVLKINRVIADITLTYFFYYTRPGILMQLSIVFKFFRFDANNLSISFDIWRYIELLVCPVSIRFTCDKNR